MSEVSRHHRRADVLRVERTVVGLLDRLLDGLGLEQPDLVVELPGRLVGVDRGAPSMSDSRALWRISRSASARYCVDWVRDSASDGRDGERR